VQLSVLRLFHQLLSDATLRGKPQHVSALRLATQVVRGLFAKIAPPPLAAAAAAEDVEQQQQQQQQQQQDREREQRRRAGVAGMVCVELLFWSHTREAAIIRDEYNLNDDGTGGGRRRGADGL
jgi:p-aminobenzoyl-glutamate transporter AbgT